MNDETRYLIQAIKALQDRVAQLEAANLSLSDADILASVQSTGTWTPALAFGGATTGITYSSRTGSYVKIGKLVLLECTIVLSSKGSATGNATITGLPFASTATVGTTRYFPGALYWRTMAANGYSIMCLIPSGGSSTATLYVSSATANTAVATDANFANSSELFLSIAYEVAS